MSPAHLLCRQWPGRLPLFRLEPMIESAIHWLLNLLAIPEIGLSAVFLISFVSATLVPMGSEPAVFAAVKAAPDMFWPIVGIATLGNTLGGVFNYWLGLGARRVFLNPKPALAGEVKEDFADERRHRWYGWLERYGARTMLLAWAPIIGDPICTLSGWLRLPFWPSVAYMATGKLLRYLMMTSMLMAVPDGVWHRIADFLG